MRVASTHSVRSQGSRDTDPACAGRIHAGSAPEVVATHRRLAGQKVDERTSDVMDLIIRNARLSTRPADTAVDIGIANGRIAAIAPALPAGGRVCAGLIETHIHLDKSRIIERCPPEETREVNPVKSVAPLKKTFTVEDTRTRAARTLEECILHGATRMRTQVEVDPGIGLRGYEAIASLIADYKWAIDI